jgi:hypothetical protein
MRRIGQSLDVRYNRMMPQPIEAAGSVLRDPINFAKLMQIKDKEGQYVTLNYRMLQRLYLRTRTRRDIILKPRQKGISTLIQAEFLRYAFTRPVTTITLMDKFQNTDAMREKVRLMYKTFPDRIDIGGGLFMDKPKNLADSDTIFKLDNGAIMRMGTAGSESVGRGDSFQKIHFSEVAYFKDSAKHIAGAGEAGNPSWIVLESTANGARGEFFRLCMEALDGDKTWTLHFWPWFVDDEYQLPLEAGETLSYTDAEYALVALHNLTPSQIKWRRAAMKRLGALFLQEYPEDPKTCFLRSGYGYFGDVQPFFTAPHNPEKPDKSVRVVGGLDFGQASDYTVLTAVRRDNGQHLATLRMRQLPYPEMRRRIVAFCREWNIGYIVAEKNSMGQPNIEQLRLELEAAGLDTFVNAFHTDTNSKREIIMSLYEALTAGLLRLILDPDAVAEFSGFIASQSASGNWSYGAADGEHDDIVMSFAFSWLAVHLGAGVSVERL